MWRNFSRISLAIRPVVAGLIFLQLLFSSACTKKQDIGNTLRVAQRDRYSSLDPAHAHEHYSTISTRRCYEGLLQYHYLKRPYELEPLLADGMPTVSKDGKTYTFKIKKGVLFQNDPAFPNGKGREVFAEDFIYSWKRLADPKIMSHGWWIFEGRILGMNEWKENVVKSGKVDYDLPVPGLKAPDSHTLEITLTKPDPLLLHVLTTSFSVVVAREVVEKYGETFSSHPVGTGPFQLESANSKQVVWVKNPNFRLEHYPTEGSAEDKANGLLADAGKPIPFVDKIIDDIIPEDQPTWLNFMQGNHDFMQKATKDNSAEISGNAGKPSKEILDKGITVLTEPGAEWGYLAFNQEDPVVGGPKNKYLRQAMSLALDEVPLIEKFYVNLARKAESLIPPGVGGYDSEYKNPYREYNLTKAREILAKAGHPNGDGIPELRYDMRGDTSSRQIGEFIQRTMSQLGLKVTLNAMSWPELNSRISKRQGQMWGIFWIYDYPDAENGWQVLYSKNGAPGSNKTNYSNKNFDALYEKMAVMRDSPARNAIFKKMKEITAEDVPFIYTVHRNETRLVQRWLKNFKIHSFEPNIEKYLRVDQEDRKQK